DTFNQLSLSTSFDVCLVGHRDPTGQPPQTRKETQMKKNVALVVAGSGEIRDLTISPGTKVGEVIAATGLQGYQVSQGPDKPFLRAEDNLYAAMTEGAKLSASTPAEGGRR